MVKHHLMTVAMVIAGAPLAFAGAAPLATTRVASGLTRPVYLTAPPGDYSRLFIIEQRSENVGRIRTLNIPANTLNTMPFLSISPLTASEEQGLLGMAFHPNFVNNGYFWVYYTNSTGIKVIERYQANVPFRTSTTADSGSATSILIIEQISVIHNGGWMSFGSDGYLYIATGDGNGGGDFQMNGQSLNKLLGKILRIDVDGPDNIPGNADDDGFPADPARHYTIPSTNPYAAGGGLGEIWHFGLRNPWRNAFDRETDDLYIADVGETTTEEINFVVAGQGNKNFGWRCYEGNSFYNPAGCNFSFTFTFPIHTYSHSAGCAVTGGYVYRGCSIPELSGSYFFADYCSSQIYSFVYAGSGLAPVPTNRTAELAPGGGMSIASISSFGEDAYGELYICDVIDGEVFKIVRSGTVPSALDCNTDGISDACQILDGSLADSDHDGIPDPCDALPPLCPGDANADLRVDGSDLSVLLGSFGGPAIGPAEGDFNGDGLCTGADLSVLLGAFGDPC